MKADLWMSAGYAVYNIPGYLRVVAKAEIGDDYELVPAAETKTPDMEWLDLAGVWQPMTHHGARIATGVGGPPLLFRRRVKAMTAEPPAPAPTPKEKDALIDFFFKRWSGGVR